MTNLRQLLAFNLKQKRCELGVTQSKLAEKADVSTLWLPVTRWISIKPSLPIYAVHKRTNGRLTGAGSRERLNPCQEPLLKEQIL